MKPARKSALRYTALLALVLGAGAIGALPAEAARYGFGSGMGQATGGTVFGAPPGGATSQPNLQQPPRPGFFRDDGDAMGNSSPSDELNCLTPQHMPVGAVRPSDC